jgi:hypothetical protein
MSIQLSAAGLWDGNAAAEIRNNKQEQELYRLLEVVPEESPGGGA